MNKRVDKLNVKKYTLILIFLFFWVFSVLPANELNAELIYFYINGVKISYLYDGESSIKKILGPPSETSQVGGDEYGSIYIDKYSGLCCEYYLETGKFRRIIILDPKIKIINDVHVGTTRKDVENKLPNAKYSKDDNTYFVAYYSESGETALGYLMYCNNSSEISKIEIAQFSFAP